MGTKIVAPVVWGMIADHTGRGLWLIHTAGLISMASFYWILWFDEFWVLVLILVFFSFFWNASLPLFEAMTLNHLGARVHFYSHIRVWGSIGFIVTVLFVGRILEYQDTIVIPQIVLICMFGIWVSSLTVPAARLPHENQKVSLLPILGQPQVIALFIVCMLVQAGHGPYYALYSKYMLQFQYSKTMIGFLWAFGVLTEVVVFLILHKIIIRWGLRQLFLFSLAMAVVRWMLIGLFPQFLTVQIFAQMLHAATFGSYHAVAIQLIHHFFKGKLQGRGQALYSALSFGAGGAIGSFYSGFIWDYINPSTMFYCSAGLSGLALWIAWVYIKPFGYRQTKEASV